MWPLVHSLRSGDVPGDGAAVPRRQRLIEGAQVAVDVLYRNNDSSEAGNIGDDDDDDDDDGRAGSDARGALTVGCHHQQQGIPGQQQLQQQSHGLTEINLSTPLAREDSTYQGRARKLGKMRTSKNSCSAASDASSCPGNCRRASRVVFVVCSSFTIWGRLAVASNCPL